MQRQRRPRFAAPCLFFWIRPYLKTMSEHVNGLTSGVDADETSCQIGSMLHLGRRFPQPLLIRHDKLRVHRSQCQEAQAERHFQFTPPSTRQEFRTRSLTMKKTLGTQSKLSRNFYFLPPLKVSPPSNSQQQQSISPRLNLHFPC